MSNPQPTLPQQHVPEVSPKLINWLAQVYPNRLPCAPPVDPSWVPRLIGQQDVIGRLRQEMERQLDGGAMESSPFNVHR